MYILYIYIDMEKRYGKSGSQNVCLCIVVIQRQETVQSLQYFMAFKINHMLSTFYFFFIFNLYSCMVPSIQVYIHQCITSLLLVI